MAAVFHPCQYNFADQDIRVDGSTLPGGTSLSGYEDVIRTDGGGFWRADFTGGDFGDRDDAGRAATLSWRSLNAGMIGGSAAVDVLFCDLLHQPMVSTGGAAASVLAVVNGQPNGLRATILDIAIISERALIGGERFTHVHPAWGPRAYEIAAVENIEGGKRITFQPPIRGGITPGDPLDFDRVRCRMRRTSPASNPLNMGAFSTASISFQEDMRPPVQP